MADLTGMMQAAAGAAGGEGVFIEDVFSCFLYTGNSSTQTITNGIDLDGEGGLVWIKGRSLLSNHRFVDTVRGAGNALSSDTTNASALQATGLTSFSSNGFSLSSSAGYNNSGDTYVSWTFRKQPKFFDVVTYTGTGANRTVAHDLGSVPGSIWVKRTDTSGDWQVYHRANTAAPETDFLVLNSTAATVDSNTRWNDTLPTDTVFTVGTEATVNASGGTYVAYLFAHDDGGFGDDGTENVITCGSFTTAGVTTINLGYEPQWLLFKFSSGGSAWNLVDNMRGFQVDRTGETVVLEPNTAAAESGLGLVGPTSTGFTFDNGGSGATLIFIAIRRGPMKVPTTGTEVFGLNARSGTGANATVTGSGGVSDAVLVKNRGSAVESLFAARLTGTNYLVTSSSAAQVAAATTILQANPWDVMDGVKVGTTSTITNASANTFINYLFDRAPGFFDVVCYTGNGVGGQTFAHNLGAVPEMMIVKRRNANGRPWVTYVAALGNTDSVELQSDRATQSSINVWNNTTPTASVFSIGAGADVNQSAGTYVAYLFASVANVQDIGTYTGNGTSLTVTTGFQPRFIVVKRTNSTGNWIVGDSARGLPAGNDPALFLNTTAAETTGQDWVDVSATGFTVNETALNANVSTGVYLYWVIS